MSAMPSGPERISRRRFVEAGVIGAASAASGLAKAGESESGGRLVDENPWRYDMDSLRRVDPARIGYVRAGGFRTEMAGVRRMVALADGGYVVAAGRTVRWCDASGGVRGEWGSDDVIRAMHPASGGGLWVATRDHVEIRERNGERRTRWPAFTGRPFVSGITADADTVFVADSGNRVIYRCDTEGRIQLRIGEKDSARGIPGLVVPSPYLDVKLGADGLLRVNNPGRHRVETYTRDGDLKAGWGRAGVALDAFCGCCNPVTMALMRDGRVVTGEKGLARVKVYTPGGALETVVAGPDDFEAMASESEGVTVPEGGQEALDVAVTADGRVAVLDLSSGAVHLFRARTAGAA